jgi:hypothetical protein
MVRKFKFEGDIRSDASSRQVLDERTATLYFGSPLRFRRPVCSDFRP